MNISTDIYYPKNSEKLNNWDGITILILQGVEVDKKEYQSLASQLTKKGFRVIIPNFLQPGNYMCPDHNSVATFLEFQEALTPGFQESLQDKFILLGHSAGGVAVFQSLSKNSLSLKICPSAIITYGSTVPTLIKLQCSFPPCLMISGIQDTVFTTDLTKFGFKSLPKGKNYFLKLSNFDHYSITNYGRPQKYFNNKVQSSLYGFEATTILAQIMNKFILECLLHNQV